MDYNSCAYFFEFWELVGSYGQCSMMASHFTLRWHWKQKKMDIPPPPCGIDGWNS